MAFQGSLKELPLADIVQLVAVSGKTGMFSLTRAAERGVVYIHNGQITHAKVGETEGEDAIYSLALWNQGDFQFSPGVETEQRTITRSNTNLLMEAARRGDEWKILSKKIPTTDAIPLLVSKEEMSEPVTLTPQEWLVVTRTDGQRSIDEIAKASGMSPFDVAKTLYGLVTSELVEIGKPKVAPRPAPAPAPAAAPASSAASAAAQSVPVVSTHSGVFNAVARGDEKRSLQILCTKVKQEAESAALAPGEPSIDRLYRHALAEIDKGRGLEVVRELIRTLEQTVTTLRGRDAGLVFREKMSPLL
ncbi:MAG TPA: DUF4388 domain-containing protein [Thermoanaerobaculia bacterium]|jgi:hypothetical protein|nr:DUF4388 domain-containing protein [Thermoanaerobaculia bacterium]